MTGAQFFSDQLAANGNSFFLTLGSYNGWKQGMTVVRIFSLAIGCVLGGTEGSSYRLTLPASAIPTATLRTTSTSECFSLVIRL
jgi:hypothetical protein